MFAAIKRELLEVQFVGRRSWAYNRPAYRRLFPSEYVNKAVPVEPEFQFMSLWGQFLDRHWGLRSGLAQTFRERMAAAQTLDEVLGSFPLSVFAPRSSIGHFYSYYGDER